MVFVKVLTLALVVNSLLGCSFLDYFNTSHECKTHAYIRQSVTSYLSTRFHSGERARIGILPFSVPANLTATQAFPEGLPLEIARTLQAQLLDFEELPIVEVLPREDWPGKRDEFSTGNHSAITMARNAGFDFVIVGMLEPLQSLNSATINSKIIDTDNGVTLWYGRISFSAQLPPTSPFRRKGSDIVPINFPEVLRSTLVCTAQEMMREEE